MTINGHKFAEAQTPVRPLQHPRDKRKKPEVLYRRAFGGAQGPAERAMSPTEAARSASGERVWLAYDRETSGYIGTVTAPSEGEAFGKVREIFRPGLELEDVQARVWVKERG